MRYDCPVCGSKNVINQWRVDMDTMEWVDEFTCGDCFHRWVERTTSTEEWVYTT